MSKQLTFVPSAYRDWTVVYCEYAWQDWVSEFKRQFQWGLTDLCLLWNGSNTVIYRAPEEHLLGLYERFQDKMQEEHLVSLARDLKKETLQVESFYNDLRNIDLASFSWKEFGMKFDELQQKTIHVTPKLLISIYLPQALEFMGSQSLLHTKGIQALIKVRDEVDLIVGPLGNGLTELFCREALLRVNLPTNLGRFISISEVKELVETEGVMNVRALEEKLRARSLYVLVAGGHVQETKLETYLTEHGWNLETYDLNSRELKGKVAYKNSAEIVTGRTVIVLNKRQLSKVQQGDIIVSPMTTPEYEPVFKKISGIVTDEGGITCHAAIVAREMKIPAVIGTKIASKVLRDGNQIEINLQTGLIRLLK